MLRSTASLLRPCNALLSSASNQSFSSSSEIITATLFPGDGIGPEIAEAAQTIFKAANCPIEWDVQHIGKEVDPRTNSMVTRENLDSVLVRSALLCLQRSLLC
jgi:isocitrate dehydrogenase (NAD+)